MVDAAAERVEKVVDNAGVADRYPLAEVAASEF